MSHSTSSHIPPCDDILLKEKVASLEGWRTRTEADLKDIRAIISQVTFNKKPQERKDFYRYPWRSSRFKP
jgi:hypothetical protein